MEKNLAIAQLFRNWFEHWRPSGQVLLVAAAMLLGLLGGAGVWLFKQVILIVDNVAFTLLGGTMAPIGHWTLALVTVIGGLVVGLLVHFFVREEKYHGVAGIMEAVALGGGRLRYKRAPMKALISAISIGSGASVGPEDPSVQIGASLGSMIGQLLHMSDERMRALVAAGAAAGISAAFNAPIAGIFFALEVVLGEISGSALGVIVLASVISAVFTQAVSGVAPAFHVPAYAFNSVAELPLYLCLGLLAGPAAAAYIRLVYLLQDLFHKLTFVPSWLHAAIAGVVVGVVGLYLPQVLGVGYNTIEGVLHNTSPAILLMLALMLAKLVLTPTSLGGGFQGGVLAPSLFIGATLGSAFGGAAARLFPGLNIVPGAFAMVGMAAVLAGALRCPLTATLLLFEMTNDYRIILPLMFAVVVSLLVSELLESDSVYTLGLQRKGVRLERGRDIEVLEMVRVEEIMQPLSNTLHETDSLARASEVFLETRHHGMPVLNEQEELVGMLTLQDLEKEPPDTWSEMNVGEACTRTLLVAYPDETIGAALRRMAVQDIGRLPVVARDQPRHLLGILHRADLVRAYDVALTRRSAFRHQVHQRRLEASQSDGLSVLELRVQPGSACDRKRVKEVGWPVQCVLSSVRRGNRTLLPHGDTLLQAGDVLVAVTDGEKAADQVRMLCLSEKEASK